MTTSAPLVFVDAVGGAHAALAAGVARSLGRDAVAATSSDATSVPAEVATVLEEIGVSAPAVERLEGALHEGRERVDLAHWPLALARHEDYGDGALERLSAARIARDRIERRLVVPS